MRRALLAALLLLSAGAARAGCKIETLAELPVTMVGQQPTIEVKLEGVPMHMLADSGAFYSVISPAEAAQLHLHLSPAPPGFYMTGIGGGGTPDVATVKDFNLAGIPLHRIDFLVGGSETGADLAGLVGRNILSLADVEYDLAGGMIRLVRAQGCGSLALAYWAKPDQAIGLVDLEDPEAGRFKPPVEGEAQVNGHRIRVIFDTGAARSGLTLAAARRIGLDPKNPGVVPAGLTSGIGRRLVNSWIAPVDEFDIGGEKIEHTRLRIGDFELTNADMLLGADFFLSHRVYVATSQHKLWFTYNGGPVFDLRVQGGAHPPLATTEPEPTDAAGFARRAAAEASRREFDAALADYDKAVALDPKDAAALVGRGRVHLGKGDLTKARADFDAALAADPGDAQALFDRALLRRAMKDQTGALADLDAADKAMALQANERRELANTYVAVGAPGRAIAQYDLWIKSHDQDSHLGTALTDRCWTRAELGSDLDKAVEDCNRALRIDGGNLKALNGRAVVSLRKGAFAPAIADFDKVIAAHPKAPIALFGRGVAEQKLGQADKAAADFTAAKAADAEIVKTAAKYGMAPP